jgi:asparagine synthase (glutamine-hydrolysing)
MILSMCGIACLFSEDSEISKQYISSVRLMTDYMVRRGPDASGFWQDSGAYLGHRRLSILDLDQRSTQPMQSVCGRFYIVFNGEIYNYKELRDSLLSAGEYFRTKSDTEVILALYKRQGEAMLHSLHGMFAFVIWDTFEKKAFVARDPYGIKPLYYSQMLGGIILASQVKAILSSGLVDSAPDPIGQAGFWMLGSVPEPHSWFKNIKSVKAGHCLWIHKGRIISDRCWHDISEVWRNAANSPKVFISNDSIRAQVKDGLVESVDRHMVSDVPLGVFLSGGIDSGALAGIMKERGASSLTGITITYDEYAGSDSDEVPGAAKIANHYGIRHHVRKVGREEFFSDLPKIMTAMDQPSIDGINTWYAAKAVAELGLKVVVSGLGGDELFLGYRSFWQLPGMVSTWKRVSSIPGVHYIASLLSDIEARRSGNARWHHAPDWLRTVAGAWWLSRSSMAPESASLMMDVGHSKLFEDFSPLHWVEEMSGHLASDSILALAQIESTVYLRNQLLRDSDWASMYHGVELRTPLVDARLLSSIKDIIPHLHRFPGKILLAGVPNETLPKEITKRRKTGFSIPIREWMCDRFGEYASWQVEVAKHAGVDYS